MCFNMVPPARLELARLSAADFKSATSTYSVIGAKNFYSKASRARL